jgi:hypothetical protein
MIKMENSVGIYSNYNIRAPKYLRETLSELKTEINNSTIIGGDLKTQLQ